MTMWKSSLSSTMVAVRRTAWLKPSCMKITTKAKPIPASASPVRAKSWTRFLQEIAVFLTMKPSGG